MFDTGRKPRRRVLLFSAFAVFALYCGPYHKNLLCCHYLSELLFLNIGQLISDLMNDRKDPLLRPSYTILHFPLHAEQDVSHIAAALRSNPVDVIVFLAYHAEADYQYAQCHMVPPTIASSQVLPSLVNTEYPIRLDRVVAAMVSSEAKWPDGVSFALAFGMGGRWYMPLSPPISISLGDECSHTRHPGGYQISSILTVGK
ncbi:uncharacterized protein LOC142796263 [Rhipicephalus microplus]|uniref:uncharacterized protein LOC142796263 n=1 Tax=Rhipicephalus microplus TaxID=6941 RepID=UPI003F6A81E2